MPNDLFLVFPSSLRHIHIIDPIVPVRECPEYKYSERCITIVHQKLMSFFKTPPGQRPRSSSGEVKCTFIFTFREGNIICISQIQFRTYTCTCLLCDDAERSPFKAHLSYSYCVQTFSVYFPSAPPEEQPSLCARVAGTPLSARTKRRHDWFSRLLAPTSTARMKKLEIQTTLRAVLCTLYSMSVGSRIGSSCLRTSFPVARTRCSWCQRIIHRRPTGSNINRNFETHTLECQV